MPVVEEERVTRTGRVSRAGSIIYVLFGILEGLLAFRFVFLLLGANRGSGFVDFIYAVTYPFVAPFYGIFGQISGPDITGESVFDLDTLVAMAVYALVAWAIVRLVAAVTGRPAAH
jgi:hypothetical protein